MNLLNSLDGASGGAGPESLQQTIDRLLFENRELKARLSALEAEKAEAAAFEAEIHPKMERGLSRAQAIAVIQRQREFDAARKANTDPNPKTS